MIFLTALLLSATAAAAHPCEGDFVYRAPADGVSIGVRIRKDPDVAEILFSDYDKIRPANVEWGNGSIVIVDSHDRSNVVMICDSAEPSLVLPSTEYGLARVLKLRKVQGSLWEVGQREGWLQPED